MRLLVLEDEDRLCQAYARRLRRDGYAVDEVGTLSDARRAVDDVDYDCLVLDRHVPGGDSLALVSELAGNPHRAAVVIVSADADGDARILGLSEGADDYVPKPVRLDELALRVGHVVARHRTADPERVVLLGPVRVDLARREVTRGGATVRLAPIQYAVFEQMVIHRNRMLTSQELLDHCWDGERDLLSNPLHTQITRLRRTFEGALRFVSVRGAGYRLEVVGDPDARPPTGTPLGSTASGRTPVELRHSQVAERGLKVGIDTGGRPDAPNPARPRLLTRARRAAFVALLLVMVVSTLVSIAVAAIVSRGVLADDASRRLDRVVGLAEGTAEPVDIADLGAYGRVAVRDGEPVGPVGPPVDRGELAELVREAAAGGQPVQQRIHVDGRPMTARAVPDGASGTVTVGVVTSHDPTVRRLLWRVVVVQAALLAGMVALAVLVSRRSTRGLESLFDQQDDLIRSVAHELRNPLSRALVAVDEGLAGASPPEEALEEAATLVVSVDELIGDLLEMARVMSGSVSLPREEVTLDQVAIDAVAMTSVGRCTVALDLTSTTVTGSARLLRRAASNLVRNAVAHAYGGGPGLIRVRVDGDGISVADDGPGIPEVELRALRFEEKLEPGQKGPGLGLNLCGWVAEIHGGRLVLANRPGGGFLASIALPDAVVASHEPDEAATDGPPLAPADRSGWTTSA